MRVHLVASVAVHSVTNGSSIGGGRVSDPGRGPAHSDDGFAAILSGAVPARGNDMAKIAKPAAQSDATVTDASDTSAPDADTLTDASARTLQSLQALQGDAADDQACQPTAANDPGAIVAGTTTKTDDTTADPSAIDTPARSPKGAQSDPAKVAADTAPTKPANDSTAPSATDPVLALLLGTQQPAQAMTAPTASATPDTSTPATTAVASDAAQTAAAALAAPATDVAAAAMTANGATAKPGKPGASDDKSIADSAKTQTQGSAAASVADAAATRTFTDQKVSSAHALPLHAGADTPKNGNQSGGSPTGQQNQNPANTNTAASQPAAPAADTAATVPNFTPTHAQAAAPQPDASVVASTNGAATPVAATQAGTPAQAAAQLQVSHPAANAAPDINTLAFDIATKSEGGARHFDIRMDPAELGRVDVRLTVDDAGKAQAQLTVEKPQTLELLQKDSTHLERALKDAGLDLTQNGLSFSLKGQQQQAGNNGGNASSSRGRQLAVRAIAAADTAATNLSLSGVSASDTRLDIRV